MIYLNAESISTNSYGDELFGANILSSRDEIGEEGTYDEKAEALGIEHIRYPGGSLTEDYFNLRDPDKEVAVDPDTGKEVELIPYSDFMAYAEENDIDVTVVLPTRNYLSQHTDENGNRFEAIDDQVLRIFIKDTLDGEYGAPTIRAFEIGNEYWGSGEMTAMEYGRVSSRMAEIIQDEISKHPEADLYEDIDLLVQNGQNYGSSRLSADYAHHGLGEDQLAALNADYELELSNEDYIYNSGQVAWPKVMNELIISSFDKESEIEAVDGLALHIYSKGADKPNSRDFDLRTVEQIWDEKFGELDKYITEWNLKASRNWDVDNQYGLKQAHEMLNMTEEFVSHGVDAAHVWAIQQNNLTNLAGNEGDEGPLNVPGEMFRMMNESLVDTHPVVLDADNPDEHEHITEDTSVHTFYGADKFVTFITSNSEDPTRTSVDFSQIVDHPGTVHLEVLGVAEGDSATSYLSEAEVTRLDPAEVLQNGVLTLELDAYEIVRIHMEDPEYDQDFLSMVEETAIPREPSSSPPPPDDPDTDDPIAPPLHYAPDSSESPPPDDTDFPIPEAPNDHSPDSYHEEEHHQPSAENPDDGGSFDGLSSLLGFLPILALLGGF